MQSIVSSSDYVMYVSVDVQTVDINWRDIIEDNYNIGGLPYTHQALAIGKEWSTLQRWLHGSQPSFAAGMALLALHSRQCGHEMTLQRLREGPIKD